MSGTRQGNGDDTSTAVEGAAADDRHDDVRGGADPGGGDPQDRETEPNVTDGGASTMAAAPVITPTGTDTAGDPVSADTAAAPTPVTAAASRMAPPAGEAVGHGSNNPQPTVADSTGTGVPAGPPPTAASASPDPFDPARLRLSQDFAANLGVKKILTTVPVKRLGNEHFVRVHPDASYRLSTFLLEIKGEGEAYLVDPSLWTMLAGESAMVPKMLFTAMSRQSVLHLWPVRLPGTDGKIDSWSESAMQAAQMAMSRWVRVQSNMSLGAYEVGEAQGDLPEPEWPDLSLREILAIAFRGRVVDTLDHPVLRRLRGEV